MSSTFSENVLRCVDENSKFVSEKTTHKIKKKKEKKKE